MSTITSSDAAKAVVRRNTEEVQNCGNFELFEELFADDFVDHHPSQTQRLIKTAYGIYIVGFVLHSPIFTQISIGRPAMAKWLRLTKRIVERTMAHSSELLRHIAKFISNPLT